MGDRSNIVVQQYDGSRIWLYGHWMGTRNLQVVREVLARRERWNDESYLARMLFNEMTKDDPTGSTGYGISTYKGDNDYPELIIVLEPKSQTLWVEDEDGGVVMEPVAFSNWVSAMEQLSS